MKRLFDFVVALFLLVILLPVLLVLALLIRIVLGSPVLFRQQRPGRHGRLFMLYKFRTMARAVDSNGNELPDELRMTPFGAWLRRASLDELPELWNVIRGDMSLVGPRPLLPEYLTLYSPRQTRRHDVRPGITGWAQVNGRNSISWDERLEMDVWYVEHRSFWLDLRVLVDTLTTVFAGRGVNHHGHVTMPKFNGTSRNA